MSHPEHYKWFAEQLVGWVDAQLWRPLGRPFPKDIAVFTDNGFSYTEGRYWLACLTALQFYRVGYLWYDRMQFVIEYVRPEVPEQYFQPGHPDYVPPVEVVPKWWDDFYSPTPEVLPGFREIIYIPRPTYSPLYIEKYPILGCTHGEFPEELTRQIGLYVQLEGLDLQDFIDQFMLELFTGWGLAQQLATWMAEAERRRADRARFRKYFMVCVAAILAIPAIVLASQTVLSTVTSQLAKSMSLLSKIQLGVKVFVNSIALSLKSFLQLIHFKELVGVHKILLLVSEDYRKVMRGVYAELAQVSNALGLGPQFLALAIQNTRNLVLDVSTSLGMRYDLSEVKWLVTMQDYLKKFSAATHRYANKPEAVFFDLARWVETDLLDTKGAFIEGLVTTVSGLTESAKDVIEDVVVIRNDINKLVTQLPDFIRSQIAPEIKPYLDKFNTFITEYYDPYTKQLDAAIAEVKALQAVQKNKMSSLTERLKKPADYLLEVRNMSTEDRIDQEEKFIQLINEGFYLDVGEFNELAEPTLAELESISNIPDFESKDRPGWPQEVEPPGRPANVAAIPRKTWFSGEF